MKAGNTELLFSGELFAPFIQFPGGEFASADTESNCRRNTDCAENHRKGCRDDCTADLHCIQGDCACEDQDDHLDCKGKCFGVFTLADCIGSHIRQENADKHYDDAEKDVSAESQELAEKSGKLRELQNVARRDCREEHDRDHGQFACDLRGSDCRVFLAHADCRDELVESEALKELDNDSADDSADEECRKEQNRGADHVAGRVQNEVEETGNGIRESINLECGQRRNDDRNRDQNIGDQSEKLGKGRFFTEDLAASRLTAEFVNTCRKREPGDRFAHDFRHEKTENQNRRRGNEVRNELKNFGHHFLK